MPENLPYFSVNRKGSIICRLDGKYAGLRGICKDCIMIPLMNDQNGPCYRGGCGLNDAGASQKTIPENF
jgi:hypothetical protein